MKKPVEYFDTDFLKNKIEIGDKVILEEPKYRNFVIGTVVTKAPKSCQIEYKDFLGATQIARQYYGQIIKYPLFKEGKWINEDFPENIVTQKDVAICSICKGYAYKTDHGYSILSKHCPHCGARMDGDL